MKVVKFEGSSVCEKRAAARRRAIPNLKRNFAISSFSLPHLMVDVAGRYQTKQIKNSIEVMDFLRRQHEIQTRQEIRQMPTREF